MILVLDFRGDNARFGAVAARAAEWLNVKTEPGAFAPLDKVFKMLGLDTRRRRPAAIVVCQHDKALGAEHVSWSTVRVAVVVGNSLAFAWGVPVLTLPISGRETADGIADMARKLVKKAGKKSWVRPLYDGLPNISTPKK